MGHLSIREGVKRRLFWKVSPNFSPLVFPNLTKTLRWVGGFTHLGKLSKKTVFFFTPSFSRKVNSIFKDLGQNIHNVQYC